MEWSSSEVLEIDDISTCAGYAHSQGRQCNNHLSSGKTEAAETFLDHLSRYALSSDDVIQKYLKGLAHCLLCPRWHEDQAESLVETWQRRILRFQRAQAMQKIQDLESRVEDITARLGASTLTVPQPLPLHSPAGTRALDQNRPIKTPRYNQHAIHSHTTDSSSRQRFTTLSADNLIPSTLQFSHDRNPIWSQGHYPELYEGASSSNTNRRLIIPTSALAHRAQDKKDQSQTFKEAQIDCPICFEGYESSQDMSRCRGCLEKFHGSCIEAWLGQCKEASINETCPCW